MVVRRINTTGVRLCCKIANIDIKKPLPKEWLFNIGCFVWVSGVFFLRLFHVEHYTLSPEFYKQYIDVGR